MSSPLRLGTRGSALALAQSQLVADSLTAATGRPVELVRIATAGDRSAAPVAQLGVTANGLADGVLRHEERYWSRLAAANGIADAGPIAAHLLALASLSGGVSTAASELEGQYAMAWARNIWADTLA